MSHHSVVEAKNNLSDLIERALRGEPVVITRHGKPVVELKAVEPKGRAVTQADMEWLDARRIKPRAGSESIVDLVIRMRDEDWR
ncbi:MAG TPA: type II toxin-antitoxin system Phd/YefM family antitoxin [Phenylobacterium sp.]|nr:type II toxin-antitoxin system Phd/YefM family antitoxin [Phenylobacterium sp.]HQP19697.1 type II toxin-antitoxin system Phd/YefM family antitoxin [Phenylobacterium sp.]